MTTSKADPDLLTERVADWRARLSTCHLDDGALDRLEHTLREQVAGLTTAGLDADEAFLVAVKRASERTPAARAASREHGERLWRQLTARAAGGTRPPLLRREPVVAVLLAVAAAAAIKLPALFGQQLGAAESGGFYARNLGLLVLPLLAALFVRQRGASLARSAAVVAVFAAGAVFANAYPFAAGGATEVLTAIHLPVALWLAVGLAHAGARWRTVATRMQFVRFSGEWFIHYVLFALGGGVLTLLTAALFDALGISADRFAEQWLLPCGVAGAVIVAGWLADGGSSVTERVASMLARVFTPLFAGLVLAFLAALAWTGRGIAMDREVLIAFDLLLVLVACLLLYSISARAPRAPRDPFDLLRLVLTLATLVADVVALAAVGARIDEFGFSANKAAALGVNLLLLAHLGGAAWLQARFQAGSSSVAPEERWHAAYLPAYGAWAGVVVIFFPVLFQYG